VIGQQADRIFSGAPARYMLFTVQFIVNKFVFTASFENSEYCHWGTAWHPLPQE